MWAIKVKFLRGVCVATDTGQWDEAEWPPHPARLFMSIAAAYFETLPEEVSQRDDSHQRLRQSLEWLERQPAPVIVASAAVVRTPVTVFVPVNDSTKTDQLMAKDRSRQPRHFPTTIPDHEVVDYVFDGAIDSDLEASLTHLAGEVIRIGHSSSFTQVWVEKHYERPAKSIDSDDLIELCPDDTTADSTNRLRVFTQGMLNSLERSYNLDAINQFLALQKEISESKGTEKKSLKLQMTERFPGGIPPTQRPATAIAIPYVARHAIPNAASRSCFDSELLVLAFQEGPRIGLESTMQLAGAVRKKIHDAFPNRTSPEWLGGHRTDGTPSSEPHMAVLPLPFVGRRHADGHLLGLALAFPSDVTTRERATVLRQFFERNQDGEWLMRLSLHGFRRLTGADSHCDFELVREQRLNPPRTLAPETWTAACTIWETVTPIALDRFPKTDRANRSAWLNEVAEIICSSCENTGLPRPGEVQVHHNAFVEGVPKARPDGGGFPLMGGTKANRAARFQVHARIVFDTSVIGPVILGAGRFVGYGLCRPNFSMCSKRRGVR